MKHLQLLWLAALAAALWLYPAQVRADLISISGENGLSGLGSFSGSLSYNDNDAHHATLTVVLKNTSPVANGGYLTAFVFNNPAGHITSATFSGAANFSLLGGPHFDNKVKGAPFGYFDFGASTGNGFEGGGNPNKGLGIGKTGTFTFTLTGNGLDLLSAGSFLSEKSVPPGAGEGTQAFVARFRGFCHEGSDKVPGGRSDPPNDPPVSLQETTPEPTALGLGGTALFALIGWAWLRRKQPA
jgi:hypothetical protein